MSVNFDYYRIFYHVAKYQNITKAAEALFVTQPSVTKAILNLERQLACKLFIRKTTGVALTPEGKMLYKHIQAACELIFNAENELNTVRSLNSGLIRIGTSDVFVRNFLLPHLGNFRMQYPNIQIKIEHMSTENADLALDSGFIDFAILGFPKNSGKNLKIRVLKTYHDVAVVGTLYSFLAEREISLGELLQAPMIIAETGSSTRECYDSLFREHGLSLVPSVELSEIDLVVLMTEHNFGVSFVPPNYAESKIKEGTLFRLILKEGVPERHICLLTRNDRPLGIASEKFIELL